MPKKNNNKKPIKKKSTNFNRYNVFQKELSQFLKDSGADKNDYKKYKSLYSQIDKSVPAKRIGDSIAGLIKKFSKEKEIVKKDYAERFAFYNSRAEFSLPKYDGKVITVKFNDGGLSLDWQGNTYEFMSWFSGDIINYFRNNYNDSPVAEFVLTDVDDDLLSYEIVTDNSIVASPRYVPASSDIVIKDKEYRDVKENSALQSYMKDKAALLKELRLAGYTSKEIKAEIKQLDDRFYGKKK